MTGNGLPKTKTVTWQLMRTCLILSMLFYRKCAGMILSRPALPKKVCFEYTGTYDFQKINHPIKHIGQDILKGLQKNSEAAIIFRSDLERQWQPEVSSTPIPKICFGSGR